MGGPQRGILAVRAHLDVAGPRLAEAVDRELGEATVRELERDEVDGVCAALSLEAARVTGVNGNRLLAEEQHQQIDEVHAALEEGPVRHRRAPRYRLVPRGEIHQLPDLAEDEPADVRRADLLPERAVDRHLAELVIDGDLPACGRSGGEHPVRLHDVGNERLLAEHVQPGLQRGDAEIGMRMGRCGDDNGLGATLFEEFLEARERVESGVAFPRGTLLGIAVGPADELHRRQLLQGGDVECARRPAEPDDPDLHESVPSLRSP